MDVADAAGDLQRLLAVEAGHIAGTLGCTVVGRAGSGHYGSVLLATRASDGADVAVKLAPHPSETLAVEAAVLTRLRGVPGFPELHAHAPAASGRAFDALVMERLGPSLHDTWERETAATQLAGPRVLHLGRGLVRCLRTLHSHGFVHNDVKPANVLLGAPGGARADTVHLIDFGLATGVSNAVGLGERGTPNFASAAAHDGLPTRPVHDVEALVYTLAFLAAGTLPWERKPPKRAAFLKRKMLADGCSTLVDSCAADVWLTDDVHAAETVEALQALWHEVVSAYDAPPSALDYDACLAALGAE